MKKLFLAAAVVALSAGGAAAQCPAGGCPTARPGGMVSYQARYAVTATTAATRAVVAAPVQFAAHALHGRPVTGFLYAVTHPFQGRFAVRGGCGAGGCR